MNKSHIHPFVLISETKVNDIEQEVTMSIAKYLFLMKETTGITVEPGDNINNIFANRLEILAERIRKNDNPYYWRTATEDILIIAERLELAEQYNK